MPDQVRSMVPWFQYCQYLWFTAYDPPKTLVPATAMASPVTTSDPVNPITIPQASATPGPDATYTATTAELNPMPLPPHVQYAPLPKETSQVTLIKPQEPQAQPSSCDPMPKGQNLSQLGSSSIDGSRQSNIQESKSGDLDPPRSLHQITPKYELLPSGISVAGTTLTPGEPLMTASGMLVSLDSTIPQSLITTVGGQIITAAATAIKIGSVTLAPGAQETTVGGAAVPLGSDGSLMIGAKTLVLAAPSRSLGGLIMGESGHGGPLTNGSSPNGSVPFDAKYNTTSTGLNFEGKAGGWRCLIPKRVAGLVVAIYFISHLNID